VSHRLLLSLVWGEFRPAPAPVRPRVFAALAAFALGFECVAEFKALARVHGHVPRNVAVQLLDFLGLLLAGRFDLLLKPAALSELALDCGLLFGPVALLRPRDLGLVFLTDLCGSCA
jgi:hypothetical protein